MMTTVFQRLQHVDYVLPYLITTIATTTSKRSSFLRCITMEILPYERDILDSYTQALKGEHSSKTTDVLIHITYSVLAFTQTGFNAMFGHQFSKPYHHQHGICAEVIHHLRLHGNPSEINDLVYIICIN